jgi:hypothetical protein
VLDLVAPRADTREAVVREGISVDVRGDSHQGEGEAALARGVRLGDGSCEIRADRLPCRLAVHDAQQLLGVLAPLVAGQEVERDPDVTLIFLVEVVPVGSVVRGGIDVDSRAVLELDGVLAGIVIDELRCRGDDAARVCVEPGSPRHRVGAVVVHVDLHRSSSVDRPLSQPSGVPVTTPAHRLARRSLAPLEHARSKALRLWQIP